jgi:NAD(P)-dependent dehydrogenase (short-subunit alcohol dehydrogenase family)
MELAGRHALVTGAARGIGAEIARSLIAAGARVSLLGRDAGALSLLAASWAVKRTPWSPMWSTRNRSKPHSPRPGNDSDRSASW